MQSTTKRFTTALLASTLLLCSTSLMAALRSRPNAIHVKSHSARLSRTARVHGHRAHGKAVKRTRASFHGQKGIDSERTLEIQQALIREHYLTGEPTGEWDQATRQALLRLQNDNHWQIKIVPDSRALIKLGLGPSAQNLLNPESAAIAVAKPGPGASTQPDASEAGAN
jgi:hypothetical protein